jgi:hypothetical protein
LAGRAGWADRQPGFGEDFRHFGEHFGGWLAGCNDLAAAKLQNPADVPACHSSAADHGDANGLVLGHLLLRLEKLNKFR